MSQRAEPHASGERAGLVGARPVRAPRGAEMSCRGWEQEAALRMLMNNLDPEVAERPDDLVVYGGTGRAARSWEAFDAIVRTLRTLDDDETLLVQSGKPVAVFRTHTEAPRVLIANANLVTPAFANTFPHLAALPASGASANFAPAAVAKVTNVGSTWTFAYKNTNTVPAGTYGGVNTNNSRVTYTASVL